jgi:pimeloyl-ACP methyl ester carboxylesterase
MNFPEWLKPVALGVVIGAVAASTIGFSWGGWVTGGTAAKMANTLSHEKVIAALVPVCVGMSRADTERAGKLEQIRETPSYQRRNILMETGWATVPGSDSADRDLAEACLAALELGKS